MTRNLGKAYVYDMRFAGLAGSQEAGNKPL